MTKVSVNKEIKNYNEFNAPVTLNQRYFEVPVFPHRHLDI